MQHARAPSSAGVPGQTHASLILAALAHICPFFPDLRDIRFRRLLEVLPFDEPIKPKFARVVLLRWLASWETILLRCLAHRHLTGVPPNPMRP